MDPKMSLQFQIECLEYELEACKRLLITLFGAMNADQQKIIMHSIAKETWPTDGGDPLPLSGAFGRIVSDLNKVKK